MHLASFALYCVPLLAQNPIPEKQARAYKQIAEEVQRNATPIKSQEIQSYVARLGAKLGAQVTAPLSTFSFSAVITGLDNALHEPFAIPGGHILVSSKLLLNAKEEAELAGMLAHAMARAPVLIRSKAGTIPLLFLDSGDGILMPHDMLEQRRQSELRADPSAILLMSRAGFDPAALVHYIERVQPPDHPQSPFPTRADRLAALQSAIRELPPASYSQSDEFHDIQEQVRLFYPAPLKLQSPPTLYRKSETPR